MGYLGIVFVVRIGAGPSRSGFARRGQMSTLAAGNAGCFRSPRTKRSTVKLSRRTVPDALSIMIGSGGQGAGGMLGR